jgi:hypothetical protein
MFVCVKNQRQNLSLKKIHLWFRFFPIMRRKADKVWLYVFRFHPTDPLPGPGRWFCAIHDRE